jgi:hypothetical protein
VTYGFANEKSFIFFLTNQFHSPKSPADILTRDFIYCWGSSFKIRNPAPNVRLSTKQFADALEKCKSAGHNSLAKWH